LRDLKDISESIKNININQNTKLIISDTLSKDDEIRLLADALNKSYDAIEAETEKLKQFLTDVSHEFKTPLMSLSSRLDVLAKKREKKSLA
jgi:signal transduction histidine kinase